MYGILWLCQKWGDPGNSFGWWLLQTWAAAATRPMAWRSYLMMQMSFGTCQRLEKHMASCAHLAACSSSGRLPWLPLCLHRTVLPLATNGSLECVMGMGLSPNWVQMVLDHHRKPPTLVGPGCVRHIKTHTHTPPVVPLHLHLAMMSSLAKTASHRGLVWHSTLHARVSLQLAPRF